MCELCVVVVVREEKRKLEEEALFCVMEVSVQSSLLKTLKFKQKHTVVCGGKKYKAY
jgi:hypothetical protein